MKSQIFLAGLIWLTMACEEITTKEAIQVTEERVIEVTKEKAEVLDFKFDISSNNISKDSPNLELKYTTSFGHEQSLVALYYNQSAHSLAGAKKIAEALPIVGGQVPWDTSKIPSGIYYITALVSHEEQKTIFHYDNSIMVESSLEEENGLPYARIDEPRLSRLYLSSKAPTIRFKSTDLEGDDYTLTLEHRCDGSKDWQVLAGDLPKSTKEYAYPIAPERAPSICELQIKAKDSAGQEATFPQRGDFAVSGTPVTYEPNAEDPTIGGGQIKPILVQYCVSCHGGETPVKNFTVAAWDNDEVTGVLGVGGKVNNVVRYMLSGMAADKHMPPEGSPQPTASELRLIKSWGYGGRKR